MKILKLYWRDPPSRGYTDCIDTRIFEIENRISQLEYPLLGPKGDVYYPSVSVSINEAQVIFDYSGENELKNIDIGVIPGSYRFTFEDIRREGIPKIEWKDKNSDYDIAPVMAYFESDDTFTEGNARVVAHIIRERSPKLRSEKIAETSPLICMACETDLVSRYGPKGAGGYEVHHLVPIADGVRETRKEDLAVLCPTCHRMIHRTADPMLSISEFKSLYHS